MRQPLKVGKTSSGADRRRVTEHMGRLRERGAPGRWRPHRQAEPEQPVRGFSLTAMAASAGERRALSRVLSWLLVVIVIVRRLDPHLWSRMGEVFARRAELQAAEAVEGEQVWLGQVRTAPPNRHLLGSPDGSLTLSQPEPARFVRLSISSPFGSAAATSGARGITMVPASTGTNGAMGTATVEEMAEIPPAVAALAAGDGIRG